MIKKTISFLLACTLLGFCFWAIKSFELRDSITNLILAIVTLPVTIPALFWWYKAFNRFKL